MLINYEKIKIEKVVELELTLKQKQQIQSQNSRNLPK